MSKKVLLTGSEGMLAYDLSNVWSEMGYQIVGFSHAELDVTRISQVQSVLEREQPDIVIYTPGIGVDTCEEEPDKGYRVHSWAPEMAARQCQRIGATFIYTSSCGLFCDETKFYSEYDPVELKTKYARSKYLGEQGAFRACHRTFVIRPGWLFGGTQAHQRNYVWQRYLEVQRSNIVRSASDKFGSPTYTADLAAKILEIVETDQYGLYHVTNSGSASRFDYLKCIVEAFEMSTPIEPVDSSSFPRSAPNPNCETLANLNIEFLNLEPMRPWQDAIRAYVASLKENLS